jgi:peptide deformylase
MKKVICNSIGLTEECKNCGASKFHSAGSCEPCPINENAKCVQPFSIITGIQTPKVSTLVTIEDANLIEGFLHFCNDTPGIVGLASNQISYFDERINKRFFCVRINYNWIPILNPEIISYIGNTRRVTEYCKTWPDKMIIAERYMKIKVQYQLFQRDKISEPVVYEVSAFPAQIFQHEIDHLNGIQESFTSVLRRTNIGRNEPCPCGSGKKFKNCCFKNGN